MTDKELSKEIIYAIKDTLAEHPWFIRLAKWGGVLVALSGLFGTIYYVVALIKMFV